jgi:hypothetical protein
MMLDGMNGARRIEAELVQSLKAGALYFGVVFGTGFVLGTIRVIWVVPRLGERTAELVEAPLMLAVTILAARWLVRRFAVPSVALPRLGIGIVGLSLLLLAELIVVLLVRGLAFSEYIASRDTASGVVYLALLAVFAVMPLLVGRR